jgi:hypothetical protein
MSLRELINRNPQVAAVVAAVIVVAAVGLVVTRGRGVDADQHKYDYYMMPDTGALIVDVSRQVAPLDNGAVRAVVFSCSDCSDKSTHVVAWVERYTDQAKEALATMQSVAASTDPTKAPPMRNEAIAVERGRLIALPPSGAGGVQWVNANAPAGIEVMRAARRNCEDTMELCSPLPAERP